MTLQDAAVDVVEHDAPVSHSTVVALCESALGWLTQHESEVGAMPVTVQVADRIVLLHTRLSLVLLLALLRGKKPHFVL